MDEGDFPSSVLRRVPAGRLTSYARTTRELGNCDVFELAYFAGVNAVTVAEDFLHVSDADARRVFRGERGLSQMKSYRTYREYIERNSGSSVTLDHVTESTQMPLEISRSFFRGELGRGLCKKFNVKVLTKKGAMLRGAIGKRGRSKAEEGSDEKGSLEIVDYKAIYRSAILKAASLFESRNGHFPAPQELTPLAISEQCESVNERNFPPIIVSSWLAQNPGFLAEVLESVKKK